MTFEEVQAAVIGSFERNRTLSGYLASGVSENTSPFTDLEEFDSVSAEEVTTEISSAVGCEIRSHTEIFYGPAGDMLDVMGITNRVCKICGADGGKKDDGKG